MTGANSETWGITHKRDVVHAFEPNARGYMKTICVSPGKPGRKQHGYLFMEMKGWDPENPSTCPVCKDILRFRKEQEQAGRKNQKVKV
jgi:hypothetical protein